MGRRMVRWLRFRSALSLGSRDHWTFSSDWTWPWFLRLYWTGKRYRGRLQSSWRFLNDEGVIE